MNKKILEASDVSKARQFIYGIAILMIVFYHSDFVIKNNTINIVKAHMDIGVEIFFFLSGVSLYFAYTKNDNTLTFYGHRLIRVLPYYLIFYGIVFTYFNIIKEYNLSQFFLNYTMLDFWINGLGNSPWFLAAILVFYLIYPLFYKIYFGKKNKISLKIVFLSTILLLMLALIIFCPHLRIFALRIPIFFIGCFMGKLVYDNKEIKTKHLISIIAVNIITLVIYIIFKNTLGVKNLFYVPLTFTIIFVLTFLYKFNSCHLIFLNKVISYLGRYTLEIYLTHEKVKENLSKILKLINIDFNNTVYQLVSIIVALLISVLLSSLIKLILKPIYNKKEKNI